MIVRTAPARRRPVDFLPISTLGFCSFAAAQAAPLFQSAVYNTAPIYANHSSRGPLPVSDNGRFVLFTSAATNPVPGSGTTYRDLYLLDTSAVGPHSPGHRPGDSYATTRRALCRFVRIAAKNPCIRGRTPVTPASCGRIRTAASGSNPPPAAACGTRPGCAAKPCRCPRRSAVPVPAWCWTRAPVPNRRASRRAHRRWW